jgi:hypothetical protein
MIRVNLVGKRAKVQTVVAQYWTAVDDVARAAWITEADARQAEADSRGFHLVTLRDSIYPRRFRCSLD